MNKDLIPVVAIGGALGIIVYLASKNQNKADEVYMPYGWGSFNNSNNPLQPIQTTPTPAPTPTKPRKIVLPYFKEPKDHETLPPLIPLPPFKGEKVTYPYKPEPNPTFPYMPYPVPVPMGFTTTPMVSKPMESFKPLSPTAVRDTLKPVTGKKVI